MADEAGDMSRVGVVGEDVAPVVEALSTVGLDPVEDTPRTVLAETLDAVVAVGEAGLLELARERPDPPVVPVDAGAGVRSVPRDQFEAVATRLADGDWETDTHPLVAVEDGTRQSVALMDAMLVTAEPAHISEFTVEAGADRVAQFRADGVVAATPAGTPGYAGAAGAPVVPPGPSVLAVVPVAPFATNLDHWVVPAAELTVTVEREEATVEVLADDRTVGRASVEAPVEIYTDGTIETVRVPEGRSPFDRRGTELEKL